MRSDRSLFARRAPSFALRASASDGETEILMYDEIGMWGIQAKDFINEIQAVKTDTIHLRINSPGGSVFDGVAIANAIRAHKAKVIVHVDAVAASIASIIAIAGDEVRIAENAFVMIHEPWSLAVGNSTDLRKTADLLDKVNDSTLVKAYMDKTGADEAQVRAWMSDETWFNADEAVEHGFADAVETQSNVKAAFDMSVFTHTPAALARREEQPSPRDAERALRDAGFSRSEAKQVIAAGLRSLAPREAEDSAELLDAGKKLLALLKSTK